MSIRKTSGRATLANFLKRSFPFIALSISSMSSLRDNFSHKSEAMVGLSSTSPILIFGIEWEVNFVEKENGERVVIFNEEIEKIHRPVLINEANIPKSVQALTNISPEMLEVAGMTYAEADKAMLELLTDNNVEDFIFIAHNALYDYTRLGQFPEFYKYVQQNALLLDSFFSSRINSQNSASRLIGCSSAARSNSFEASDSDGLLSVMADIRAYSEAIILRRLYGARQRMRHCARGSSIGAKYIRGRVQIPSAENTRKDALRECLFRFRTCLYDW